tara:strand:- start:309 stop:818 length:510 start_codon:yes stop_codon:yes gene_type:complete
MALTQVINDGLATSGLPAGSVVQVVHVQDGEVASGTTTCAYDDTIMQNTEGTEFMTLAITPTNSNHKLKIDVVANINHDSTNKIVVVGLFQDSTANALAQMNATEDLSNSPLPISFTHFMTAGTTSSTTFKVRSGTDAAATVTFNGRDGSNRRLGGRYASTITITEIAV